MNPQLRGRPGFTLMEVLLALALTMLLVGAVFSFMENLGQRRDELARVGARARDLATLIDRIEADLTTAVVGDARGGAGIVGKGSEISVLTRRVVAKSGRSDGDLSRASYVFDAAGGVIRAGMVAAGTDIPPSDIAAEGIRLLRFRYFDGRAWRAEFDSQKENTLPAAVEIAIWSGGAPSAKNATPDGAVPTAPVGEPDRVRTVVIPDGPSAAWKEER